VSPYSLGLLYCHSRSSWPLISTHLSIVPEFSVYMYLSVPACHLILPLHTLAPLVSRSCINPFCPFIPLFYYFPPLAVACCSPQPHSLRFSFFFHNSRFSFLFTFATSVLPICLFSVHTLYKISRFFSSKYEAKVTIGTLTLFTLMSSSTTLYQSTILQDDKRKPSTSTSVCKTLA